MVRAAKAVFEVVDRGVGAGVCAPVGEPERAGVACCGVWRWGGKEEGCCAAYGDEVEVVV